MSGRIVELLTAESAGAPMLSVRKVELVAGIGIAGDRYATRRGHWSDPRWPDQELTLLMAEVADRLRLPARALRRNVVTRGVELDDLIGVTFAAGGALLLGVRRCDPCRYIEQFTRDGALRELVDRGGLRVHIVRGGRLSVGDAIVPLSSEQSTAATVVESR